MPRLNVKKLQEGILRRLAAVELTSPIVDKPAIEIVLEKYLCELGLTRRPIIWGKDGLHAQKLAAEGDTVAVDEERRVALERVFGDSADDGATWNGRSKAREAGSERLLEMVMERVRGYDVLFSIPWAKYRADRTGERGLRVSPQFVPPWDAAESAFEYAVRASGECSRILDGSEERIHESNLAIWTSFLEAYEAGLWYFWITASSVVALPRPSIKLNAGILHSEIGPAISWPEGEQQFFFLNGVHVSAELVDTPARDLDPRLILREMNVGVRREIVRKIGIERICHELETESLDQQGDYELILLDLQDGRARPFLKMKNPSVGVYHIEGVAPQCRTVAEALAWRNQSDVPPSVLT